MDIRLRKQNTDGNVRVETHGDIMEILINENLIAPDEESISLCWRGKNSSGIVDLTPDEFEQIYEKIKSKYEPQDNGKFLAIDTESRDVYLADSTVEAVEAARTAHPNKVFYVVKIGFDYVETTANYFL